MKEKTGVVFSIARDNQPVAGCTISRSVQQGENSIDYYSLAKGTDISAEIYPYHKLLIVADGKLEVYGTDGAGWSGRPNNPDRADESTCSAGAVKTFSTKPDGHADKTNPLITLGPAFRQLTAGESILTPTGTPVGMRTKEGTVYTEISIKRSDIMNEAIKAGEVFKLADLVPYQEGRIVNMDVVHNDTMKFVVMAFDAGTGLQEHAAPGEAIIFALEGEGIIGYEGKAHPIKAGENFHFAKGGLHYVKADKRFKMALLLTL